MDRDILHKEIDLIQACITRMAQNSFMLKGWAISLVAVVLALADKTIEPAILSAVLLIPLLSFWYLDAFFLRTEKKYRKMYEWILPRRAADDASFLYDLNPKRFDEEVATTWQILWSITLRWFYGMPALLALSVIIFRVIRAVVVREVLS